jgi:hypothetical protein
MRTSAPLLVLAISASVAIPAAASIALTSGPKEVSASAPISRARLEAIVRAALRSQTIRIVHQSVAVPLGLTAQGTPYETKQAGFGEASAQCRGVSNDICHLVAVPVSGTGRLLFAYTQNGDALFWVCDMNGTLLAAGQMVAGVFSPITLPNARASFEAEMRQWRDVPLPGE